MESKYEIILYWSKEDESFIAEVPELAGCMADGKTYIEAIEIVILSSIELNPSITNKPAAYC